MKCPKCHSEKVIKDGDKIIHGGPVKRYRCKDCGHSFTEKKAKKEQTEEHKTKDEFTKRGLEL